MPTVGAGTLSNRRARGSRTGVRLHLRLPQPAERPHNLATVPPADQHIARATARAPADEHEHWPTTLDPIPPPRKRKPAGLVEEQSAATVHQPIKTSALQPDISQPSAEQLVPSPKS